MHVWRRRSSRSLTNKHRQGQTTIRTGPQFFLPKPVKPEGAGRGVYVTFYAAGEDGKGGGEGVAVREWDGATDRLALSEEAQG